jgi:DNA-binding winged helix-turn-helix (wHTH) protein
MLNFWFPGRRRVKFFGVTAFRFGDAVFDVARRELLRGGTEVRLSPRAFEALHLLLKRHPEAVSKQDLYAALWPDTFVNLTNLNNVIAEIRKALGDDDRSVIVTKQRFGYAVAVPVRPDEPARRATRVTLAVGGQTLRLSAVDTVIGRSPDGDVVIDDPSVSRRHAILHLEDGHATLTDLQSKNGTFVGDERIDATRAIRDGDVLRFGNVCAVFRSGSAGESTITA